MKSIPQHVSKFTELDVKGFRRLKEVKLPMRPLCVMIGANGVGKTSILDALWLLANSAQGRLNDSISELGGLTSFLTYDWHRELYLGISMDVQGREPLKYSLELQPGGTGYSLSSEALTQARTNLQMTWGLACYGQSCH